MNKQIKFLGYCCKNIIGRSWLLFANGLLTLLPIVITFSLFSLIFSLIKTWLSPLKIISNAPLLDNIPHSEILLALGIIFISGILFKSLVAKSFVELFEYFINRMPLIRTVYSGVKQLVHAFSPNDHNSFQKIVILEFPRSGLYSIGFLTSKVVQELSPEADAAYFNIFLPTTPNPTTGYFVMVKETDFKVIDLTTQEAMALIISGGIVQPKRFNKKSSLN